MNNERLSELRYKGHITDSEYKELKLAIKALKARPKGKWIPVSERLPDNNDEYLVIDADGNFGVGYYREDAKAWDSCNWGWLERSNSTDDTCPPGMSKVIAWMPLPEKYKEVENDLA